MTRAPDPAKTPLHGRYQIGALLAHGAGSAVHAAIDLSDGRAVVVKLLSAPPGLDLAARAAWLAHTRREVDAVRRLRHTDIVALLGSDMDAHPPWLALERVLAPDLSLHLRPDRRLAGPQVLHIAARLARALAHAHGHGVVHRDLKPANVLVDLSSDTVKLTDFGAARIDQGTPTHTGMTLGTPAYMAPELLRGGDASPASDAYALGVMVYELLALRRPHEAATLGGLLRAVAHSAPHPIALLRPDLSAAAAASIDGLLRPQAAQRPHNLLAWADGMERLERPGMGLV